MPITKLLSGLPARTMDQSAFDVAMGQLMADLPAWGGEVNALAANLNSIAAGGAYAYPYVLDTTTTAEGDPGDGKMRFNQYADQSSSSFLYLDDVHAVGSNVSGLLDGLNASTSAVKGKLRIIKVNDATRFLTFNVTGVTAAAGYRKIAVSGAWGYSPSPFANGDMVVLHFERTGDKGDAGIGGFVNMVVLRSTQSWTPPVNVSRAKITVVDGGQGAFYGAFEPGNGGKASVSIRAVNPAVAYTATVGGGGAAAGSGLQPGAGGASSFSGSGLTTLTSSNGDLVTPGGRFGDTLFAATTQSNVAVGTLGIGQGGSPNGNTGTSGAAGAIIIEY